MAEFIVRRAGGMGVMHYFRVHARSAREIMETFADLQVVTDPATLARAGGWVEDEIDIDALVLPAEFEELRAERDAQRGRPGFGALADRGIVYLRERDDDADETMPETYLYELGPDGYRLRQVELYGDGTSIRRTPEDWLFDAPIDLYAPELAGQEITAADFEAAWGAAGTP
ncbi:hypothetical protein [Actinoplanes philippinensis]|uniref:hypothetical protein n=1 Tax=Actinoplanes philippinensis TaxID=35752 RepID=UPI0033C8DE04